jgi:acyl-CoA hydrolase
VTQSVQQLISLLAVQVDFERPVDVGDLVTFESRVVHTRLAPGGHEGPTQLVVQVKSMVNQPDQLRAFGANTFTMMCAQAAAMPFEAGNNWLSNATMQFTIMDTFPSEVQNFDRLER